MTIKMTKAIQYRILFGSFILGVLLCFLHMGEQFLGQCLIFCHDLSWKSLPWKNFLICLLAGLVPLATAFTMLTINGSLSQCRIPEPPQTTH